MLIVSLILIPIPECFALKEPIFRSVVVVTGSTWELYFVCPLRFHQKSLWHLFQFYDVVNKILGWDNSLHVVHEIRSTC
ncbi:hypothetical protein F4679DRAFT_543817 [Xylaria curta]|nr:hypothetical protein F4679DRAFT_543817 [Xylaria curta]